MQKYIVAQAKQINAFLSVVFAVVNPFNGKVIAERFGGLLESDAVVTSVQDCFAIPLDPFAELPVEYPESLWLRAGPLRFQQSASSSQCFDHLSANCVRKVQVEVLYGLFEELRQEDFIKHLFHLATRGVSLLPWIAPLLLPRTSPARPSL